MNILLLQLDGKLPNVALMRLAAHHRDLGDDVELRRVGNAKEMERAKRGAKRGAKKKKLAPEVEVEPHLWDCHDRVYASLIFERTRPLADALLRARPDAVIGGTGWDMTTTLEQHGCTTLVQDYSIYPRFKSSIGFLQRGCRLRCPFCVVPEKEGGIREEQTVSDLWRGVGHPRELHLLDNDFFGNPSWRDRISEIRDGGFKVSFSQGINARFLTEETAAAIASVDYRCVSMKERRVYTAWDNAKDKGRLMRGLQLLVDAGVKADHIMIYMLVGYWAGETHADRDLRRTEIRNFGARPYPMPFVRTRELVDFQRWVIGGYDKSISWDTWLAAGGEPRRLNVRTEAARPSIAPPRASQLHLQLLADEISEITTDLGPLRPREGEVESDN